MQVTKQCHNVGFPGNLRALHSWALLKSTGGVGASLPLLFLHNANLCDWGDHTWHTCIRWHCFFWCGYNDFFFNAILAPERCDGGGINTSVFWLLLFLGCDVLTKASFTFSIRWFASAAMKVSIFFFFYSSVSWILVSGAHFFCLNRNAFSSPLHSLPSLLFDVFFKSSC